jgi:hypothetical protein
LINATFDVIQESGEKFKLVDTGKPEELTRYVLQSLDPSDLPVEPTYLMCLILRSWFRPVDVSSFAALPSPKWTGHLQEFRRVVTVCVREWMVQRVKVIDGWMVLRKARFSCSGLADGFVRGRNAEWIVTNLNFFPYMAHIQSSLCNFCILKPEHAGIR